MELRSAPASSLVATGGGLIFVGDAAGSFRALDDASGKVLFNVSLGAPVSGYPITFAVAGSSTSRSAPGRRSWPAASVGSRLS